MKKENVEKLLRVSLLIGGVYDIILAIGCFLFLENIYGFFGLNTDIFPDTRIFAHSTGVFVFTFGCLLVLAARNDNIDKWQSVIAASIMMRFVYLPIVLINVLVYDLPVEFVLIGMTDLTTGVLMMTPFLIYFVQKQQEIRENGKKRG
ncbi:MAG: hypothetical protein ACTSP4_05860 [Candidatus Hodarchaeales archaeon]